MFKSFNDMIAARLSDGQRKRNLAVVCAESEHTLEGVAQAHDEGLVHPILIGNSNEIKQMLHNISHKRDVEFVEADGVAESLEAMVSLVKKGACDAVMKGRLDTREILGAVVKKDNGMLSVGSILNSVTVTQIPTYHKLMMIADPGMIIYPTLEQKAGIVRNCLNAFRSMGYQRPKVGILSCVDKVNPKIESTVHAEALTNMAKTGEFGECSLYGPLSYDLIVSQEAARIKGVDSDVCGDADIVIVPNIDCGNPLTKALSYSAGAVGGGVVLGAKIPVLVPSRSSTKAGKYYAIVVGCAL